MTKLRRTVTELYQPATKIVKRCVVLRCKHNHVVVIRWCPLVLIKKKEMLQQTIKIKTAKRLCKIYVKRGIKKGCKMSTKSKV